MDVIWSITSELGWEFVSESWLQHWFDLTVESFNEYLYHGINRLSLITQIATTLDVLDCTLFSIHRILCTVIAYTATIVSPRKGRQYIFPMQQFR